MIKLGTENIFNIPTIKKAYLGNDLIYKKYTELDYIESTGTQWIDTLANSSHSKSVTIEMNVMYTGLTETRQLMGANSNPYFRHK